MRDSYVSQLKLLHGELTEMGMMCEEAIASAIRALTENDDGLRKHVFAVDAGIDRKEREIENLCLRLILRQQPVASDLREISSALKMVSDMERIGDQASDIAEIAAYILGRSNRHEADLHSMAAETIRMVNESIEAFIKRDLSLAQKVIRDDDIVDDWFSRIRRELIGMISERGDGEYLVDLLMIAKYLERIADHATNIAEWVVYAITATHPKDHEPQPEE